MADATPHAAAIAGTGSSLPGKPIDNTALGEFLGVAPEWISRFVGTEQRYLAMDLTTGEVFQSLAEMAADAAMEALQAADTDPGDLDFIVMGTATPDELMPATVNHVADRLAAEHIPTYQVQSGCAGAVQALSLAERLLTLPEHTNGLVIGADTCVKHCVTGRSPGEIGSSELVNYMLFGDGAGAAVLTSAPRPGDLRMRAILNRFTGAGKPPGQTVRWFGQADRDSGEPAFSEDYKAIEERVPEMAAEILWQLLDSTGWRAEDVGHLLPPQLSGSMTPRITRRLALPAAREVSCVAQTGNNANALPFLQLDDMLRREEPVGTVVGIAVESSKWLKAGFALEREE
ncbi:3-oxoacyl-ACP synthase III family protein [Streptomonospora salina]|uniref:3-oxoacyl-[acyl-carrier-protein] synthase-3 n=1 Tax=Streptomonospora salina TaxID=104205 RepID=A0A841EL08_9ACTN|nr:3-oxoacyl-ACP synthase III family protein [Streptomonospora salina]MBB6001010.1 3-oxoacyl-[acyl-carrier-protein] synthase-3 [Streptomonospora salina]